VQTLGVSMAPVLLTACISAYGLMRARHNDGEERARGCRKMLLRELRMRLAMGIAKELEAMERENPAVREDHDAYVGKIAQTMNDYLYGHDKIVVDFVAIDVSYDRYVNSVFVLTVGVIASLIVSVILMILPLKYPSTWSSEIILGLPTFLTFVLVVMAEVQRARFNRLVDRYEVVLGEKS